jgi:pSer/pThr/pTyr-binding forkhead associated (FHA) protein
MVKRYQLRGQSGPVGNRVIELMDPLVTLGRDLSNDIVIPDSEVSRSHARLSWQVDGYLIEDLRSTNGTWVNGHPVLRGSKLHPGDTLTLGKVSVFVYELIPEPVTDTTPNQDAAQSQEIIESTMLMPAWQRGSPKAGESAEPRPVSAPAQPEAAAPAAVAAAEEARPVALPDEQLSQGRTFHRRYLACLQSGDLEGLGRLYHPDATLLTEDKAFTGSSEIAMFFGHYFGGAGHLSAVSTGNYVEGRDSVLCEASLETTEDIARVRDVFVLLDGKATHQFTSTVEITSKATQPHDR